jgi:HSP20 family protein
MTNDILPRSFLTFPQFCSLIDEDDTMSFTSPTGLSVSEDNTHVYVEAALPGVDPKNVEITFDKGVLWIKGETAQEEKEKKFYRKATSSFSYRVAVAGELDLTRDPEAESVHGVMKITFTKSPITQPKKITVKTN